jgi:hypothetical protein
MNVTMLSDITRPDGRSIEKWAYEGSYPAIPQWTTHVGHGPPPAASWKIWKHAISSTFLTKDRTNVYYPLNTPLKRIPKARRPRTRKQPQLQDVINALSEYYKEVLGTYKLPDDNGNAILQQLQSKTGTKS